MDLIGIIWHSGIVVKMVLLSLIISSIFSWAIIIKKKKLFLEMRANNKKFFEIYSNSENLKEVMIKSELLPASPFKFLFINGHAELIKMKEACSNPQKNGMALHFQNFGMGHLERGLKKGVNESNEILNYMLSLLASIGSVSPFIGLFGTVWGIINAFSGLAKGGGSIDAVAPGIAEALVTTAVGLATAIPAVWFYNLFSTETEKMNAEMESFGLDFLNEVERSIAD